MQSTVLSVLLQNRQLKGMCSVVPLPDHIISVNKLKDSCSISLLEGRIGVVKTCSRELCSLLDPSGEDPLWGVILINQLFMVFIIWIIYQFE